MNCLMAGMVPVMMLSMARVSGSHDPRNPAFWFVMSMALLAGLGTAYPMNWWLVSHHMKHGMMTVRAKSELPTHESMTKFASVAMPGRSGVVTATIVSLLILAAGLSIAFGALK